MPKTKINYSAWSGLSNTYSGNLGNTHTYAASMSVGERVFSKTAHRFVKLLMKLGCLKGKNCQSQIFGEKSHFGDNAQKHPKNRVFWILQKNSLLICRFFGFKLCIIMTFMILLKPHVWEKSGSRFKCQNAIGQSDCRMFKL